jgi:hypothetical protein
MEAALERVLATGGAPSDLTVVYDDMHGLWGGTTLTVRADGSLTRATRATGAPEPEVTQVTLDAQALVSLVRLLVELRAWEQRVPERPPVAGEGRATLTLRASGATRRVWERVRELQANDRLVRVRDHLAAHLARPVRGVP